MKTPQLAFLLLVLSTTTTTMAQVPGDKILVGETTTVPSEGLTIVDTTGKATSITGNTNGTHTTVALDPREPFSVWGTGPRITIGSAEVDHYILKGSNIAKKGLGQGTVGQGVFGRVLRFHVFNGELIFTMQGSAPGLYRRSLIGGSATQLATIADAHDIAVMEGKVYVSSLPRA